MVGKETHDLIAEMEAMRIAERTAREGGEVTDNPDGPAFLSAVDAYRKGPEFPWSEFDEDGPNRASLTAGFSEYEYAVLQYAAKHSHVKMRKRIQMECQAWIKDFARRVEAGENPEDIK